MKRMATTTFMVTFIKYRLSKHQKELRKSSSRRCTNHDPQGCWNEGFGLWGQGSGGGRPRGPRLGRGRLPAWCFLFGRLSQKEGDPLFQYIMGYRTSVDRRTHMTEVNTLSRTTHHIFLSTQQSSITSLNVCI